MPLPSSKLTSLEFLARTNLEIYYQFLSPLLWIQFDNSIMLHSSDFANKTSIRQLRQCFDSHNHNTTKPACADSPTQIETEQKGDPKKKKGEASTAPITIHKNSQPDHVYVTYKESQMCADSSNQLPLLSLTLWARTQGTIRLMPFVLQIWEQRKGHGMKHDACVWHQYPLHTTPLHYPRILCTASFIYRMVQQELVFFACL
jgi:hypothetical protein